MPELSDRVVDEVRRRLNAASMSGRSLAELAGVPQRTIADKLARRSPLTLDDLEVVCGVLGVAPADVLMAVEGEGIEIPKAARVLDVDDEGPAPFSDAYRFSEAVASIE